MSSFQNSKKWQIALKIPPEVLRQFPEINPLLLQILWNRGIISPKPKAQSPKPKIIEEFLEPKYEDGLYDPFLIKGMEKAILRILKAIKRKEKIALWGDYDTDGICAAILLFEALNYLGAFSVEIYLPEKETEGYGLNKEGIKKLAKKKISLIITCDCGISSVEEVKLASSLGIEVVISDHHKIPERLPDAYAILNPHQRENGYPFADLSGVGVTFKLAQALLEKSERHSKIENQNFLKWQLDLVALGTLADIVSVTDENRVLVKYGLLVLSKTQRPGLSTLFRICNITPSRISSYDISYKLAPRLNAAGRLASPYLALNLLLEKEPSEAAKIALDLDQLNLKRQRLTEKVLAEAKKQIEIDKETKLIIVSGKRWPLGILGNVASRLKEEYGMPTLVLSEANGQHTGSARSIDGFDITEALGTCGDLLLKFGGHARAAGLSLTPEAFESLAMRLHDLAGQHLTYSDLSPILNIDAILDLDEINIENFKTLQSLEPFGLGNPKPNFLAKEMKIQKIEKVGGNRHLKLLVSSGKKVISAIGFGLGKSKLNIGEKINLVFNLILDDYNNQDTIALKIIDFKKSSI